MKLYSIFGRYYGTQAEAKAAAKESGVRFDPEQNTVEVPTDKEGLIQYLNQLVEARDDAFDAVTGGDQFTPVVERQDPTVEQSSPLVRLKHQLATARPTLELDALFEAAPIGQQLTLASIAMENARSVIGFSKAPPKAPQGYQGKPQGYGVTKPAKVEAPIDEDELFS